MPDGKKTLTISYEVSLEYARRVVSSEFSEHYCYADDVIAEKAACKAALAEYDCAKEYERLNKDCILKHRAWLEASRKLSEFENE